MSNQNTAQNNNNFEEVMASLHHEAKSEEELLRYLKLYMRAMYQKSNQPQCLIMIRILEALDKMAKSTSQVWDLANYKYPTLKIEGEGTLFTSLDLARQFDSLAKSATFHPFGSVEDLYYFPQTVNVREATQEAPMTVSVVDEDLAPSVFPTPRSTGEENKDEVDVELGDGMVDTERNNGENEKYHRTAREDNGQGGCYDGVVERAELVELGEQDMEVEVENDEPTQRAERETRNEGGNEHPVITLGDSEDDEADYEEEDKCWEPSTLLEQMMLDICKKDVIKTRKQLRAHRKRMSDSPSFNHSAKRQVTSKPHRATNPSTSRSINTPADAIDNETRENVDKHLESSLT